MTFHRKFPRALLDTTSFQTIANSNHTCAVKLSNMNQDNLFEETIRKINARVVSAAEKIRYKVILALNRVNENLCDPRGFDDVPLELMPQLLEILQQDIGCNGFGKGLGPKYWDRTKRTRFMWNTELGRSIDTDRTLPRLFEVIKASPNLPLLFQRGAGKLEGKKKTSENKAKRKAPKKRRKRRKFGDEDDADDGPYDPKGRRKCGRLR